MRVAARITAIALGCLAVTGCVDPYYGGGYVETAAPVYAGPAYVPGPSYIPGPAVIYEDRYRRNDYARQRFERERWERERFARERVQQDRQRERFQQERFQQERQSNRDFRQNSRPSMGDRPQQSSAPRPPPQRGLEPGANPTWDRNLP